MNSFRRPGLRLVAPNEAFAPETARASLERRLEVIAGIRRYDRSHLRLLPAPLASSGRIAIDPYDGPAAA
jgi:hypothetical protein